MNTTDIPDIYFPDLVSSTDRRTKRLAAALGPSLIHDVNRRYHERMAEFVEERRRMRADHEAVRRQANSFEDDFEKLRQERNKARAERNTYAAKIERLQPELDNAHQTIAKLQLDVGILNGRLIERTDAMGERQREYMDRARKAEAAVGHMVRLINEAVSHLEATRCLDSSDTMFKRDALRALRYALDAAALEKTPNPDQE